MKSKSAKPPYLHAVAALFSLGFAAAGQYLLYFNKSVPLGLVFFAAAALVFAFFFRKQPSVAAPEIKPKTEALFFIIILLTAAFFRFYKISEIPAGCFPDEAQNIFDAVKIEHGELPVYVGYSTHNAALFLYPAAFLFKIFGADITQLRAYSAFFGFLSVPALYFLLRSVSGPRLAIIGGFLFAVMRWHFNFNRIGYHASFALLMFVLVLYFVWKCREEKFSYFLLLGASLGIALNTYQSARLIPFWLALVLIFVFIKKSGFIKRNQDKMTTAALAAFLLFTPLFFYAVKNHTVFFERQREVSVFKKANIEGHLFYTASSEKHTALTLIKKNLKDTLLMFHHKGDKNPRHNLPGLPALDFITGIFFLLGFALALTRITSPPNLLFISCFVVFIIPGFITIEAPQSLRLFFLIPCAVYFSSVALLHIIDSVSAFRGFLRSPAYILSAVLVVFAGHNNFINYFEKQAKNAYCWQEFATDAYEAGKHVKSLGESYKTILTSDNYKIRTFNLAARGGDLNDFTRFRIEDSVPVRHPEEGKNYVYMLNPHYRHLIKPLFEKVYPSGRVNALFNKYNTKWLIYLAYEVSAEEAEAVSKKLALNKNGLILRRYAGSMRTKTLETTTPLVFTDQDYGELSYEWEGKIKISADGAHIFSTESKGASRLYINGVLTVDNPGGTANRPHSVQAQINLKPGYYPIKAEYSQGKIFSYMQLIWKQPEAAYEIVPYDVLFYKD